MVEILSNRLSRHMGREETHVRYHEDDEHESG